MDAYFIQAKTLEVAHTRQLLRLRDFGYKVGWPVLVDFFAADRRYVLYAEVVAILSEREHVPTKAEAKAIRQNKAKVRK